MRGNGHIMDGVGIERGESRRDRLRYSTEKERYSIKGRRERYREETWQGKQTGRQSERQKERERRNRERDTGRDR